MGQPCTAVIFPDLIDPQEQKILHAGWDVTDEVLGYLDDLNDIVEEEELTEHDIKEQWADLKNDMAGEDF